MSENSPNLALPYLLAAQAQKHVTVNEALRILDGLVQLSVIEARASPPASPASGTRYLVTAAATGAWAGWEGSIALFDDNAWRRLIPREGWLLWNVAAAEFQRFDGSVWVALEVGTDVDFASGEIEALGVATGADATNRLAVASPASLFTHAGAGHQLKINKAAAGDTASLLFQTDWSGRAEMGLAGEDDFSFKVSPDGAAWHEGIRINRNTGRVRVTGFREVLEEDRTYYVRKDGNDANTGRSDDAGGAFLTIGRAFDEAYGNLDLRAYNVDIQVRAGIYEETAIIPAPAVGAGIITLRGDPTTPDAVVLQQSSGGNGAGVLYVIDGAAITLANLKIERTGGTGNPAIDVRFGASVTVEPASELWLGAASTAAIRLISGFFTAADATIRHVANSPRLFQCAGGNANLNAATIDVDGRHYSAFVFQASRGGILTNASGAFSMVGTASGPRVQIVTNGVIDFGNFALSSIPGSSDGIIGSGGRYLPGLAATVERGSNSNGRWVRFSDGTQICWQRDLSVNSSGTTWTFPASFDVSEDPPSISANPRTDTLPRMATVSGSGGTSCGINAWQTSGAGSGINCDVMAIGRWK